MLVEPYNRPQALRALMHTQTFIIDRVFDTQHTYRWRNGPKCTVLGVEVQGKRYFSVVLNGWLTIRDGAMVTAIFDSPGNWKKLVGWVDHQTGQIISASAPVSTAFAVLMSLVAILALVILCFVVVLWGEAGVLRWCLMVAYSGLLLATVGVVRNARKVRFEHSKLEACKASMRLGSHY